MIREFSRQYRIAQEIQKKIAFILKNKIKDPRLSMMITINNVVITRDLAYAKVYVTFLNDKDKDIIKDNVKLLQEASSYIRSLLSKIMYLRIVPKLTFLYDHSLMEGMRISNLAAQAVRCDEERYVNCINSKTTKG